MKIAVYGISLNESKLVERFMRSAREADLVLIADRGSDDDTVEILQQFGAKVMNIKVEPFRFDDARNAALALVPDEFDCLISLDLDETIEPERGWRKAIESEWKNGVNRLYYLYTANHRPDGTPDIVFKADKIHNMQFHWNYPVHEVLKPINKDVKVIAADLDGSKFHVHHWPNPFKDRSNYLSLLKLAVKEDPSNDRNMHYLAREYYKYGRWRDAIKSFRKHLSLPTATWSAERAASMRFMARCYLELGEKGWSEVWYLRACAEDPDRREPWIELAKFYFEIGFFEGCLAAASRALRISIAERNLDHYLSDEYSWREGPFDLIAISAWNLGYFDYAKIYIQKAVELAPHDDRIKKNAQVIYNSN